MHRKSWVCPPRPNNSQIATAIKTLSLIGISSVFLLQSPSYGYAFLEGTTSSSTLPEEIFTISDSQEGNSNLESEKEEPQEITTSLPSSTNLAVTTAPPKAIPVFPPASRGNARASTEVGNALAGYLQSQGYAAIPISRGVGNHLEMTANINGQVGVFLLDTGAQISVIHRGSLNYFRLKGVKTGVRVFGAVGGPGERIEAALAKNLQIGPWLASPFLLRKIVV